MRKIAPYFEKKEHVAFSSPLSLEAVEMIDLMTFEWISLLQKTRQRRTF